MMIKKPALFMDFWKELAEPSKAVEIEPGSSLWAKFSTAAIAVLIETPVAVLNEIVTAGTYLVQLNLIDWNQEPGALLEDGSPSPEALPDLIVFIDEYVSETKCRHSVETFRKEDALR